MSDPSSTPQMPTSAASAQARQTVFGEQDARILERLERLDPALMAYIRDFAYGEVYERGGLELKQKELLAVALLVAQGAGAVELKTHLRGAMRAGATETELREALLFCIPYLGFPRVVGAFAALAELLETRE